MTIYLLVREDQNQHGFVDTGVIGAFRSKEDAEETAAQRFRLSERTECVWTVRKVARLVTGTSR